MKTYSFQEDPRSFPYQTPSKKLLDRFETLFRTTSPLPERPFKRFVDLLCGLTALVLTLPVWFFIAIAIWADGKILPENAGPVLDPYIAGSSGKKFLKLKFRTLKWRRTDRVIHRLDFRRRPSEHDDHNLTRVGRFLKKSYLDEIPQILNILRGDISLVGPRPLAWHHYLKTVRYGHPLRLLLKAGLLSPTHVRKGAPTFPDMSYDYEYAEKCMRLTAAGLLAEDISVVIRGIKVMFEARGL